MIKMVTQELRVTLSNSPNTIWQKVTTCLFADIKMNGKKIEPWKGNSSRVNLWGIDTSAVS